MELILLFLLTSLLLSGFQALNLTINERNSSVHEPILQCPPRENCHLKCIGIYSCYRYNFICISNSTTCSIECHGRKSCSQMHAIINNSNYFYFYSSGRDASRFISLNISNTLQVILSIPSRKGEIKYSLLHSTIVVTSVTLFSAYVRIFFCLLSRKV